MGQCLHVPVHRRGEVVPVSAEQSPRSAMSLSDFSLSPLSSLSFTLRDFYLRWT